LVGVWTSGAALASAGCDTVNGGLWTTGADAGEINERTIGGFAVGDVITFTVTRIDPLVGGDGAFMRLFQRTSATHLQQVYVSPAGKALAETTSYTIPVTNFPEVKLELDNIDVGTISVTAVCTPFTGPTDSQKLRSVQVQGSRIVAQNSGSAIASSVGEAIGEALAPPASTGGSPAPGGAANLGGPAASETANRLGRTDAAPMSGRMALQRNGWNAWASLRHTDSQRQPAGAGFDGRQTNGLLGVGRMVAQGVVVGVMGGYESFKYTIPSLTGRLDGDGLTGGAYFGWAITPTLRFDALGARTALAYDAEAGAARGTFRGQRDLLSAGLTGRYETGGFMLEPSARVFMLWERQKAYIDSLGAAHDAHRFSLGTASAGLRLSRPIRAADGTVVTPFAGLFGDYRFSSELDGITAGTEILALPDGWSTRVVGGLNVNFVSGLGVSVSGELGGLGTDVRQRSISVRGKVPF
jgi:outer membrane autotransporter protein